MRKATRQCAAHNNRVPDSIFISILFYEDNRIHTYTNFTQ
ncbi:MAG: hypothetical protein BWX62_00820 [Bacteroidetes bacterium ADurb.Bin037]|nr:MAG: hypothetical protein BWX62_00820 [Bacteroidetes bacterium ADurb.Bin037]